MNGIVFVVDDDPAVLKSLQRLIKSEGHIVETFSSAQDFLEHTPPCKPCCLILDVQLPGLSGLDLQEQLHTKGLAMPIIFISGHGNIPITVQAMKAGAVDFLEKPFDADKILNLIQIALEQDTKAKSEQVELDDLQSRFSSLTDRERQVFRGVIGGMLNKQIACELGITEKTVKVHRAHVMQKMQVVSVAELVRLAEKIRITPTFS